MNEVQDARKELMDTIIKMMKSAEEKQIPLAEMREMFEEIRKVWDQKIPL
jgi:predicted ribonuclease toxin of YeeF-YezG toxin-antitoxin module